MLVVLLNCRTVHKVNLFFLPDVCSLPVMSYCIKFKCALHLNTTVTSRRGVPFALFS